ncbi:PorT family protein [Bacteroides sp. 214]|uniref:porin family protein n=1 Tax=Bacteroides sp. 214 TaxID=2302935 RepID=UPI0013D087AD|nr:porin family protein [Bacteroides sp. 214]NDW13568.1 PorT family protein [Bacteroides sp. 214]
MKKLLLSALLSILFVGGAFAQEGTRWGIVGGMNVSNFNISGFDSRIGFNLGARAEFSLSKSVEGLYLDAAALLSLKGAEIDGGSLAKFTVNPYYLEIPIHLGYKYAVNDDFSIFGSAGPYLGFGLFGKAKVKAEGESMKEDVFGDDGFKRFDFGLGLKAGFEIAKKYRFAFGYDFGLIEADDENLGIKNRNFSISFAYMF